MALFDLTNKTALVCGSTQGIGKACAEVLAAQGAKVILLARNEAALQSCLAQLPRPQGQEHRYLVADFAAPLQVAEVLQKQLTETVHILVNNTGGPAAGLAVEAAPEAFLKAFEQHLLCNQYLLQAVVEKMKAAGYGRVINIISTSVKQPIAGLGVSNTIRGAVASWAKTLSRELGPWGITVNNVLPGATQTQRLEQLIANKAQKQQLEEEVVRQEMLAEIPAGRLANAEEIAWGVLFLASPQAAYINGINLPIDGGRTASL
jgi:3-oxoacyl-[acyl-carrier protein] reductase